MVLRMQLSVRRRLKIESWRLLSSQSKSEVQSVAVKAYYVARSIDFRSVYNNAFSPNGRPEFQTKSVTIEIDDKINQYITVYSYGSIVMFNIPIEQHKDHLRRIKESAVTRPIEDDLQHQDNYTIMIHKQLDRQSVIKAAHLNIRSLDKNNLTIVSDVMAQTVALDFYAVAVDRILETFMKMNVAVEKSGDFNSLDAKSLHKLVASKNRIISDVLSKLGIFEGTDATWDNSEYYDTWEALRKDFEIDERFKDLSMKLNIVKENSHFFLEILHNHKSTKMEVIIIVLIGAEIVIGLLGFVQAHFAQ